MAKKKKATKSALKGKKQKGAVAQKKKTTRKRTRSRKRWTLQIEPPPALSRQQGLAGGILLLILSFLIYSPSLRGGFIWDDVPFLVDNELLRSVDGLWKIWFEPGNDKQYYPLTYTTLWINYQIGGTADTLSYHLFNVLLHAVNSILVWVLLRRLAVPGAFVAALLFAVHPVHVESVAWIIERKNVLSCLFFLSSALLWINFSRQSNWRLYALALLAFIGGMFSKTLVVTLPFVLLLWIWWKGEQQHYKRDVLSLLPMVLIGAGLSTITMNIAGSSLGGIDYGLSFLDSTIIAGKALWFYLGKLLFPFQTMPIYPRWAIDSSQLVQYVPALLYGALLFGLWRFRKQIGLGPLVAFLFFGMTHGPSLSFFKFGFLGHSFVADHFQYIPSIAMIAFFVAAVTVALQYGVPTKSRRIVGLILAVAISGIFAVRAWQLNYHYQDAETFWKYSVDGNPIHTNMSALGDVYLRQAEEQQALAAAATDPNERARHTALAAEKRQLAASYVSQGQDKNATPRGFYRQGELYIQDNDYAQALDQFEKAIVANRNAPVQTMEESALYMAGYCAFMLGDDQRASEYFVRALAIDPNLLESNYMLGKVYNRLGNYEAAIPYLQRTIELQPGYRDAQQQLELALRNRSSGN